MLYFVIYKHILLPSYHLYSSVQWSKIFWTLSNFCHHKKLRLLIRANIVSSQPNELLMRILSHIPLVISFLFNTVKLSDLYKSCCRNICVLLIHKATHMNGRKWINTVQKGQNKTAPEIKSTGCYWNNEKN